MRNYNDLKAFKLSDELVLAIYRETNCFPREEIFGLTSQIRRGACQRPPISSRVHQGIRKLIFCVFWTLPMVRLVKLNTRFLLLSVWDI